MSDHYRLSEDQLERITLSSPVPMAVRASMTVA